MRQTSANVVGNGPAGRARRALRQLSCAWKKYKQIYRRHNTFYSACVRAAVMDRQARVPHHWWQFAGNARASFPTSVSAVSAPFPPRAIHLVSASDVTYARSPNVRHLVALGRVAPAARRQLCRPGRRLESLAHPHIRFRVLALPAHPPSLPQPRRFAKIPRRCSRRCKPRRRRARRVLTTRVSLRFTRARAPTAARRRSALAVTIAEATGRIMRRA